LPQAARGVVAPQLVRHHKTGVGLPTRPPRCWAFPRGWLRAHAPESDGARAVAVRLGHKEQGARGVRGGAHNEESAPLEHHRSRTFFTPPVAGALLRAALVASCLRGALPPVLLLQGGQHREASERVPTTRARYAPPQRDAHGDTPTDDGVQAATRTEPSAWYAP
jgi:hypothetical protein